MAEEKPEREVEEPEVVVDGEAEGETAKGSFNVDAPAFVPRVDAPAFVPRASAEGPDDLHAKLLNHHKSRLRGFYQAYNGEFVAYYVGCLKTFNMKNGYGFIECKQSKEDWGCDVFIHKNNLPNPPQLGQPVEFAVQVNSRGQPQAYDCNWLPRLPAKNVTPGTVPALPGKAPAGGYPAAAAERKESTPERLSDEPRRLGSVKSFSATRGFGFIACSETHAAYKRDVYLDKSQMSEKGYQHNQLVEFSVSFNDRNHPQARKLNWDPVPLLTSRPDVASRPRQYANKTVEQLKRLLKLLHEKNVETAVVTAIDLQGGANTTAEQGEAADADVDYVLFVLDRMGDKEEMLKSIKDFVKMLFVLMLSRMLRAQRDKERTMQLIDWYRAVAQSIQTNTDAVKQHFPDVLTQINNHIKHAVSENSFLKDKELSEPLFAAFMLLKDKGPKAPGKG
ncbi:unnamed protein product [Effrenium voratum]|uniref:CSD domain-containing protein n=1 Tax=Effrenium voratum TaxID=2562239 RepID=A0AA36N3K6_9DINO|nr:unnamed protein product [Effrenium voratum]CAJ1389341.1 unnamed protein product [Effrenium voratum]CAJ1437038.1 unnamed protein product [Effrenium voratum]|eukprot:CAMPEP_0181435980 /NCGR_PEP_ID=MMETSP1110-20121109/20611_1 /TAXON_ID=174948 /ORGANISM="Symbiodinium sp., Strain CCMP421" /LENGTH=448 /DNA_ID=CAMNT_0023559529 /DNA_START=50 /DNA_END=1396 /DNA_ORIENTATION=+